jgi:hypothetical protein
MLLFLAALVLVVAGLLFANDTIVIAGWVVWAIGCVVFWLSSPGRYGFRAIMNRKVERDVARLLAAAEAADPKAMRALGAMYKSSGEWEQAELWLRRAAEAGNRDPVTKRSFTTRSVFNRQKGGGPPS